MEGNGPLYFFLRIYTHESHVSECLSFIVFLGNLWYTRNSGVYEFPSKESYLQM